MNIHDLKTKPVDRIEGASDEEIASLVRGRTPLIFSGLKPNFNFLQEWDLDLFATLPGSVPVQQPENDGVNYFVNHFRISFPEFVDRIRKGDSLYLGARRIMTEGGKRTDRDGLGDLATRVELPSWIDRSRIYSANLWIGAGSNRTLLHYDPWDGFLTLASGKKDFVLFPGTETRKLYQHSALDFRAMYKGAVIHSRIRPLDVQEEYQARFSTAEGLRGSITAGEMIFIPAGFWHYVESSDLNIGMNFFVHFQDRSLQFKEPLRTYWIKDNITIWPMKLRDLAGRSYYAFFPKKTGLQQDAEKVTRVGSTS